MPSTDPELIFSPLGQVIEAEGHRFAVEIYRTEDSDWILEVVDELNTSIVWDEHFASDSEALDEVKKTLREEGAAALLQAPPPEKH